MTVLVLGCQQGRDLIHMELRVLVSQHLLAFVPRCLMVSDAFFRYLEQ